MRPSGRQAGLSPWAASLGRVEPLLARAARREAVERTPVWFMRQAGRSLPEYRAIRERHAFFEVNGSAELTAEVTLQPVRRHDVDAAVMFADIMTPVLAMGLDVQLVEGVGPVVAEPVRSLAAVEKLRVPVPEETVAPVLAAIGIVRRELRPDQAVVGFCGGPFTVAGYLVEGKPSRDFAVTKTLMYTEPEVWAALLDKLAETFAAYVVAQARAGADVVQLFDSWVGALSPADYEEFVAPWSGRVLAALREADVPSIHFGTGTTTLLPSMAAVGGDVIGLDWRVPLDAGWSTVGHDRGVQGNLDPTVLFGPWERVESSVRDVLARAASRPGHIFNLGHGVLPRTDPDVLGRVRELVHELTASGAEAAPNANEPSGAAA
jgi:uroporphyrinogen decarboxylase